MNDRVQYRTGYPGSHAMARRGYKRLASGVWQKVYPANRWQVRVIVDEDRLNMTVTIVDNSLS